MIRWGGESIRKRVIPGLLLLAFPALLFAQETPSSTTPALFSLEVSPGLDIPLGASSPVFGMGGAMRLGVDYRLPVFPLVYFSGGLGYDYDTANGAPLSVSVTDASLGTGLRYDFTPSLSATIGASGGYFFSFLNASATSGGNPFVSVEAGMQFLPGPWHVKVAASYVYDFGLYNGLNASVGMSYDVAPSPGTTPVNVQPRPPVKVLPLNKATGPRFALVIGNGAYAHVTAAPQSAHRRKRYGGRAQKPGIHGRSSRERRLYRDGKRRGAIRQHAVPVSRHRGLFLLSRARRAIQQ